MEIARRLEEICQSLTSLAEEGNIVEFLTNAENAQRINGLVDDIYGALMEYQVCISNYSSSTMADLYVRLHCNRISTMRVVSTL